MSRKYILIEYDKSCPTNNVIIKYFDNTLDAYSFVGHELEYEDMDIEDFYNPPYSGIEERLQEHGSSYYLYRNGEEDPLISLEINNLKDDSWDKFTSFCLDSSNIKENKMLKYKQFNEGKKDKFPNIKKVVIDGFNVYIGRDAKSNDHLTFNVSNKEDIWMHVKGHPGSHVIISVRENIPTKEVIKLVAELTKKNSKVDKNSKSTVVYCQRKFVKKEPGMNDGQVKVDYINAYEIIV